MCIAMSLTACSLDTMLARATVWLILVICRAQGRVRFAGVTTDNLDIYLGLARADTDLTTQIRASAAC